MDALSLYDNVPNSSPPSLPANHSKVCGEREEPAMDEEILSLLHLKQFQPDPSQLQNDGETLEETSQRLTIETYGVTLALRISEADAKLKPWANSLKAKFMNELNDFDRRVESQLSSLQRAKLIISDDPRLGHLLPKERIKLARAFVKPLRFDSRLN
jgi:hypothetical protein